MLYRIRKASSNIIVRVMLILIAVAFVVWGIEDILKYSNQPDYIIFTKAKNISEKEFLVSRNDEINNIQKKTGSNLTDSEIQNLNINQLVTQKLIANNLLEYLGNYYDLDPSDNLVISFMRQSDIFKNDKGEFDLNIFKSHFNNSYQSEENYLQSLKQALVKESLINIFVKNFQAPKFMEANIIDYLTEVREIDLVSLDLKAKFKNTPIIAPSSDELLKFYNENAKLFTIPEKRSFSYTIINPEVLMNKIFVSDEEIQNFYEDNNNGLKNKSLNSAKDRAKIKEIIIKQNLQKEFYEFAKKLEDNVASGLSLQEISTKYDLKTQDVNNVTYEELLKGNNNLLENIDNIFDLTEKEVSYPIELKDGKGLLILEMKNISPQEIQDFESAKIKLEDLYNENKLKDINIKNFEDYRAKYPKVENLFKDHMQIKSISLYRSALSKEHIVPSGLVPSIFSTKIGSITPILVDEDKAYFAFIKATKSDHTAKNKLVKTAKTDLSNIIKKCVMEELISYLDSENKVKINKLSADVE